MRRTSLLFVLIPALAAAALGAGIFACSSDSTSASSAPDGSTTDADGSVVTGDGAVGPVDPALDLTFATGGSGTYDVDVAATRAALGPNDSIIVLGKTGDSNGTALVRLTANGVLDPLFGTHVLDFFGLDVGVDSAGTITVVGTRGENARIARFLSSGAPDTAFAAEGKVTRAGNVVTDYSLDGVIMEPGGSFVTQYTQAKGAPPILTQSYLRYAPDGGFTQLARNEASYELQERAPDGRIVVIRATTNANGDTAAPALLVPDGGLDTSFGDGGVGESVPLTGTKLVRAPDGSLVLLTDNLAPAVHRFTAGGAIDPTFKQSASMSLGKNSYDVAVTADGKVVVGGYDGPDGVSRFVVARLGADGALDASFAKGGVFSLGVPLAAKAGDLRIVVQSTGRIVAVGSVTDAAGKTRMQVFGLHP